MKKIYSIKVIDSNMPNGYKYVYYKAITMHNAIYHMLVNDIITDNEILAIRPVKRPHYKTSYVKEV